MVRIADIRGWNGMGEDTVDRALDIEKVAKAARWIVESTNAVALTGAGISVESGIPDFRGNDGLWTRYDPAEYATIDAFRRNPGKVWRMLREVDDLCVKARPNPAHSALAGMERSGHIKAVITQNIDGLHQEAGSTRVIEFHGNGRWLVCQKCSTRYPREKVTVEELPPRCGCDGVLKPDVVLFGEPIPYEAVVRAHEELKRCDVMLIVGTSGLVSPAADIPYSARSRGARIVEVNLEPTPYTNTISDLFFPASASRVLAGIEKVVSDMKA